MRSKTSYIIGIDEVGRGPLAGPVTICALLIPTGFVHKLLHPREGKLKGVRDSKQLSAEQRKEWHKKINTERKAGRLNFVLRSARAETIDKKGIATCVRQAIASALKKLGKDHSFKSHQVQILLDGSLYAPAHFKNQKTIIRGDESEPIIALASIVAKVKRDTYMRKMSKLFPAYSFDIHKGYGTSVHRNAIKKHGPCELHRTSFITKIAP